MISDRIAHRYRSADRPRARTIGTWFCRVAIAEGADSPALRAILADPGTFLALPGVRILETSRRSTVGLGWIGGRAVVVKRTHRARRWRTALRRAFSPSRAARAWHFAPRLAALGIPTAPVLAYAERRFGPLRVSSCQVLAYLDGVDALTFLSDPDVTDADRDRVLDGIARILERLHEGNISHRDNRIQNFILVDGEPHIIDLDCMYLHTRWSPVRRRYINGDWQRLSEHLARRFPELGARFAERVRARTPRAAA